jgi:hypothetical protein
MDKRTNIKCKTNVTWLLKYNIFDFDVWNNMFVLNVGLSPNYKALQPTR